MLENGGSNSENSEQQRLGRRQQQVKDLWDAEREVVGYFVVFLCMS